MRKRNNIIVENVDFTRLSEILRKKHIKWSKLSRKCGYDDSGYVRKNVFGRERLNWTVADTLERVYGITPDEYCYEKAKKSTSNDGQFALRLDKELIARFRNWAFYNQMSQKDAMEKILSEYLDGEKITKTISTDDTAEKTISNNDTAKTTASDDDTYKFIVSINGEFLKRLAMASLNEHTSIENFIFDCIWKSVN